jgi:hypothetical protein
MVHASRGHPLTYTKYLGLQNMDLKLFWLYKDYEAQKVVSHLTKPLHRKVMGNIKMKILLKQTII